MPMLQPQMINVIIKMSDVQINIARLVEIKQYNVPQRAVMRRFNVQTMNIVFGALLDNIWQKVFLPRYEGRKIERGECEKRVDNLKENGKNTSFFHLSKTCGQHRLSK